MLESMAVGNFVQQWSKGVLILCIFALALDPLFLYIPEVNLKDKCMGLDETMRSYACILRSIVDALYLFHIALKFRRTYPYSTLFKEENEIIVDVLSILPAPQICLWMMMDHDFSDGPRAYDVKEALKFIIFGQSIPRIMRIYPILYKQVKSTSGFLAQTAWVAAAFNIFLYVLAGHAAGAFWYAISVDRQETCWRETCVKIKCNPALLYDCDRSDDKTGLDLYVYIKSMNDSCPLINPDDITDPNTFDFGIFIDALRSRVTNSSSKNFGEKLFYCSWWGMRNLSSLGQNLKTSTFVGEVVFAYGISIFGLVLFALLIGNMQTYIQSISGREEKMRVRKGDEDLWMSQRSLPDDIKKKVRKYEQSKWQLTKGVEEEALIKNLPMSLRKEIHRHIWKNTFVQPLNKIRIFKEMSQQLIDEMFDRLKPVVFPDKTTIIKESEAVCEILFITKGSMMTNSVLGEAFYFTSKLKVGDLCGEELLTWACDPNRASNHNLPISTREVITESQVEAYALAAEDFKSIASKFQSSIDKKQLDKAVKFHSSVWRTQGAFAIQNAWRRHKEMKQEKALSQAEQTIPPLKR